MNDIQNKVINEYCDKYGGVKIIEDNRRVILQLAYNMVIMEGISYIWLNKFSKCFYDVVVGLSDDKDYPMYITMFKIIKL